MSRDQGSEGNRQLTTDHCLELRNIEKSFQQGEKNLNVLSGTSLSVKSGETVAIVGESGCGKSTFIQIAGLLEKPDSGSVHIDGVDVSSSSDKKCTMLRRDKIGFVYQQHHLLPEFSALENVMLPQIIAKISPKIAKEKAIILLDKMHLSERVKHRPAELSGGEQQRVAIARALANDPLILLADEPTGNLDPATSARVFDVLLEQVTDIGLSMLIVTHNMELAAKLDRTLTFRSGKLEVL